MFRCHDEPALDDVLSDPVIRLVMAADHVEPSALEAVLLAAAHRAGPAIGPQSRGGCCGFAQA